jgi:hypothetical protein
VQASKPRARRLGTQMEGPCRLTRNRTVPVQRYPRGIGPYLSWPVAAKTGRLDPTPCAAAAGAWKEAIVGWPRSRRPGTTANGEAPAMAGSRWPPSVAQGVIAKLRKGPSGKPKYGPGQKSPHAGAGRQPPDREVLRTRKVLEGPRKGPLGAGNGSAVVE